MDRAATARTRWAPRPAPVASARPLAAVIPLTGGRRRRAFLRRLERMTPEQRLRAARRGRLSRAELTLWAHRYPEEVPLVNGEHAWIGLGNRRRSRPVLPFQTASPIQPCAAKTRDPSALGCAAAGSETPCLAWPTPGAPTPLTSAAPACATSSAITCSSSPWIFLRSAQRCFSSTSPTHTSPGRGSRIC